MSNALPRRGKIVLYIFTVKRKWGFIYTFIYVYKLYNYSDCS